MEVVDGAAGQGLGIAVGRDMCYVLRAFEVGEKGFTGVKVVEVRGRQGDSDIAEGDGCGGSEVWRGRLGKGRGAEAGLNDRFLLDGFGTCGVLAWVQISGCGDNVESPAPKCKRIGYMGIVTCVGRVVRVETAKVLTGAVASYNTCNLYCFVPSRLVCLRIGRCPISRLCSNSCHRPSRLLLQLRC